MFPGIVKVKHNDAVKRIQLLINAVSFLIRNIAHHYLSRSVGDKLLLHAVKTFACLRRVRQIC